VLVNDVLQNKGLMDGAVLWPVACLSRRPQIMLLCEVDQALNQDASIQPAEGLAHCCLAKPRKNYYVKVA